jgi:hypothetical protein
MKDLAVVAACRLCGQGRLIVTRELASGTLYVSCEECESEWVGPESVTSLEAATQRKFGESSFVEREELAEHPWSAFVRD